MIQDENTRQWAMLIHISQLAGVVVPIAGLVIPIVIWQIKKEEMPELDLHGKIVANWMISELIYFIICGVLLFVLIGFLLFIPLGIVAIVFPIIGALKAKEGRAWKYPLSICIF
ncbi:MAG: DUF4870 domain-containing protein [Cyanobacteria bacterium P01_H01_bin.15]